MASGNADGHVTISVMLTCCELPVSLFQKVRPTETLRFLPGLSLEPRTLFLSSSPSLPLFLSSSLLLSSLPPPSTDLRFPSMARKKHGKKKEKITKPRHGIYQIRVKVGERKYQYYVGKTRGIIESRVKKHFSSSGSSDADDLMVRHGKENCRFRFVVLTFRTSDRDLLRREAWFIKKMKSDLNTMCAGSSSTCTMDAPTQKQQRELAECKWKAIM